MAETKEAAVVENTATLFTKEQLMSSKRYAGKADVLDAVLADGTDATLDQVDKAISDYYKKEVK